MNEKRFALIIASYEYEDPELRQLVAPAEDAEYLGRVLKNPDIGGFEVQILLNQPYYVINEKIEKFFAHRNRDDILLLYFSGHGIKDEKGYLYFATTNTKREMILTTGIRAALIHEVMQNSRSRRQILLLDCCYSGAFARGMVAKADKTVGTKELFEGRGYIVLTASDAMQYSFEGSSLEGSGIRSVFTHTIVRGLETGEADLNQDGVITVDELYDYVFDHVTEETSNQIPKKWAFDIQGDLILAHNPHIEKAVSSPLKLLQSPFDDRGSSSQQTPPQEVVALDSPESKAQLPEMVLIQAGEFRMGDELEQPIHMVYVDTFQIGRYPVTNREYRAFVQDLGSKSPYHWCDDLAVTDDHPVTRISWYDAIAYCQWLSSQTGKPYRLPTEAEWEKSAGWDTATQHKQKYPWGNEWDKNKCNSRESGVGTTTPVSQYVPYGDSAYGVSDLCGNVWEWCSSLFLPYEYRGNDGREDLEARSDRVLRGGSFSAPSKFVRCAFRLHVLPKSRENEFGVFGFRLALTC